jgi:hypothetical protein
MKVEHVLNELEVLSTEEAKKFTIDEAGQKMVFKAFTENIYSNPIGTVVREITSNSLDSHIEAGVKEPVVVEMRPEHGRNYILFHDFGMGMSQDRVDNIYTGYFKSTKRNTNDQNGAFGIGGKTPLAYGDRFFHVITRYNGVEYTYHVFLSDDAPAINLVGEEPTSKRNGTTIKVPIVKGDESLFEYEALRQLYYFEDVVFRGFGSRVVNDYNIFKGENFVYRGRDYSDTMHICYGQVAYPIDYRALGIAEYDHRIPVAVKIGIGELRGTGVTMSREAINYTPENVQIIKAKIEEVKVELAGMLTKQYENVHSLDDYYQAKENFGKLLIGDDTVNISNLVKRSQVSYENFKYKAFKSFPTSDNIVNMFFDIHLYGKPFPKYKSSTNTWYSHGLYGMKNVKNIYYTEGEFKRVVKKQGYCRWASDSDNFFIVQPYDMDQDFMERAMIRLGLAEDSWDGEDKVTLFTSDINKNTAKKLIRQLQEDVFKYIRKHGTDYDALELPQEYLDYRKQDKLGKLQDGEIPVKFYDYGQSDRVKVSRIAEFNGEIYYGFQDDQSALGDARMILKHLELSMAGHHDMNAESDAKFAIVQISKGNAKYLEQLENAKHVDEFKGDVLPEHERRIMKHAINRSNVMAYTELDYNIKNNGNFKWIDPTLYSAVQKLRAFWKENEGKYDRRYSREYHMSILLRYIDEKKVEDFKQNFKFELQDELDYIRKATELNRDLFHWVSLPSQTIDPDSLPVGNHSYQILVDLIQLGYKK